MVKMRDKYFYIALPKLRKSLKLGPKCSQPEPATTYT